VTRLAQLAEVRAITVVVARDVGPLGAPPLGLALFAEAGRGEARNVFFPKREKPAGAGLQGDSGDMSLFSPPDTAELQDELSNLVRDAYREYTVAVTDASALVDEPDGGQVEQEYYASVRKLGLESVPVLAQAGVLGELACREAEAEGREMPVPRQLLDALQLILMGFSHLAGVKTRADLRASLKEVPSTDRVWAGLQHPAVLEWLRDQGAADLDPPWLFMPLDPTR